jgi:putative transposase
MFRAWKSECLANGVYQAEYHVVLIPKYRRRILNPGTRGYSRKLLPEVMRSLPGCEIIELNIQVDQIRMLIVIPPKYGVSAVIGQIKQYTARKLRKSFRNWGKFMYLCINKA